MKYLFYPLLLSTAASAAQAQDLPGPCKAAECVPDGIILPVRRVSEGEIIVVATGNRETIEQTGQAVGVIVADEIARVQGADLTRVLERLPGVTFTRNGGLGSTTGLFVRGANSEQLLVLVDGVRMEDTAAPSGGFDLGTLTTAGIGKIELLRGSNSVAWGSAAIGGVLAVSSDVRPGLRAAVEYGSNASRAATASGTLTRDDSYLSLSTGYTQSDGISALAGGAEPDGFRQWTASAKGKLAIGGDLALVGAGRYADSRIDFDGFPPPDYLFADTPEYQTTRQASGRTGLEYRGQHMSLDAGVALSDTRRSYFDPTYQAASNFDTAGRSLRADVSSRIELADAVALSVGADSEWTRFDTTFDPRRTARLASGHALIAYRGGRHLNLTAGLRYDDHDRFGGRWSFGADGALYLGAGWRVRGSFGQGFKAPTLYQLYGYGGNNRLRPETSESFDIGLEQGDRNGPLHLAVTLFRRDSRDLISYLFPSGYFNTAKARAQGVEVEAAARVSARVTASAAYTYVEATDRDTGGDLARRPRHALTASLDWNTPLAGLVLGADMRLVGDSFDDAANAVPLDGYALATVRASLPVGQHIELFGRIENVTDARYQVAAGYGTYGRSAYAGARLRW
ncbi:TonB-dependent siderophore receptor [Novosphingobium sp.]|uniref:TonB-dependent receptor plug domain-containing protein n=1 Tax=Novosphingobium sp. TaxID=1874826 RepID=UPI0025CC9BF5|nr:TonB-dependent receptor [Novosphingobium sp.]